MAKISELAPIDRPREKMLRYGTSKMRTSELLAILLRTGTHGMSAVEISERLLKRYGGKALAQMNVEDLRKDFGIGMAKACEIVACFEIGRRILKDKKSVLFLTAEDVWKRCDDIRRHKKEHLVVFYLNVRNQEIQRETISVGTLTNNLVHPREVFENAILHSAAQVLVAHNHPSNDVTPSKQDCALTQRLRDAGNLLGIELIDHVIVSSKTYFSMQEHGFFAHAN